MANGFTEFPKFPVQFTEQDQERIETLTEQKKEMERIYFAHFAPQAWEAKPFISRAVRGIAAEAIPQPSWLRGITPWLEKGFTPEQFDVFRGEVESEFQELQRLQLVSERVSKIKDHLALLALMDKLTGSKEQLYELIPELDDPDLLPLRDIEREWIEDFYQHISSASREDIEAYYEGRELTDAELRENIALFSDKGILSPSQVLSTVAFSKDIGEITGALQTAYPPTTIDGEATFESIKASDLWDEMERLGLVPSRDMERVEEDVKALETHYESQDEELGSYTSLTDTETGETLLVRVKDDNTVWYEERLVGRYSPTEEKFTPLTPDEWYVIQVTEDRELYSQKAAEAMNKLIAAGEGELYERALAMYKQHKITMNSIYPEATDSTWSNFEAGVGNMVGAFGGALKWAGAEGVGDNFSNFGDYLARKALPGVPLRGEEGLQVGGFLRTTGVRTLGFLLALIPAAILGAHVGVGAAGVLGLGKIWTLILGATGAAGFSRPIESVMEAGGTYEQALDMGMTEAEASDAFTNVFWNNMKLTGMDAFQFGLAFAPLPAKIGGRIIARGLVRTVLIGGKVVIVGGTEALEEYLQERWTRMALGQEIEWDAEMEEAVVLGGLMGITLGGAGEVYTRIQGRTLNNVSEESRTKYELTKEQAIKEGKDENLANLEALEELVSTPEGKEAFTTAVEDVMQEDNIKRIKDPEVADAVRTILAREQTLPAQTQTELREQKREMRRLNTEIGLNSRTLEILRAQIEEAKSASVVEEVAVLDKQIEAVEKNIEIAKQKVEEHETRLARSEIIGKTKAELELQAEMVEVAKKEVSDLETKEARLTSEKESIGKVTPKDEAAVTELEKKISDMETQRKGVSTRIKELKATEAPTVELPIKMISKKVWNSLIIPARTIAAKAAGLEGKVGSKSWESLTDAEKKAIGSQPKIKVEIVADRAVLPQGKKFGATVYRGVKEEGVPLDEGLVGKATYYTTSREYAETYGEAQEFKVSLRNALVLATEANWETFSYRTRELRDQALEQGKSEDWVQETLREQLESEGYDGVVIGKGIVEVGEQVAVFYPEQAVSSVIEVIPEVAKTIEITEGVKPATEQLEAVEENKVLTIDPAKADAQAENMIGFSEQKIDPLKIDVKNIRRLNEEVDARLFEPDFTNPLDIAASTAMYTGDVHAYAEALPPNFKENVSQEFKDAEFANVSYWNLMRMDTIRAIAFIDNGNFGGITRQKVLRPTERLHMAKIRKFEQHVSWFMDLERRFNMDSWEYRRMFGTKEGQDVIASVVEKIEDFPDAAIKTVEEHLQREDVQEIVGKYPRPVQEDMIGFAQGMRVLFDSVRAEANVVRIKMGKEPIGYIKNYLPWVYEVTVWGKFFGLKTKPDFLLETAPPPDYIKPSEPFNPRALEREGGLKNYHKVRDVRKLFLNYADVMTQDMFYTPIVQNAKAHAAVMMGKAPAASQWVVDWAVESYAGVPGAISRALRRILPPPVRHGLLAVRRNLTRAVFPLNWPWNLIIQPSSMALTTLHYGTGNTLRATWECLTKKDVRDFIHQHMFSFVIKQRLEGSVLYQDIGTTIERQHALSRSKLDTVSHYANFLTRIIEQGVTTISIQAAYLEGKKRGYTGRKLIDYASEGGAKTQSMYNPQNVPGILRSPEVGALVPFQTFAFEAFNSMAEMSGIKHFRSGAWHTAALDSKTGQELRRKRLMHFGEFLVAIYILNLIGELAINRKPWQPSSFIPFASLMMSGIEPNRTWNYPLPVRYVSEFYRGMRAFFEYGNWQEITNWAISYHSPGGVQIARTFEGIIAVIEGRVTDVSGEKVLYVIGDDPLEWIKAITMGVYQTEAGQQWAEQQFEGVEPTANEYLKDLLGLEELLGKIVEEDTFLPSGNRVPEGRYLLTDFASDLEAMLVDWEKKRGNLIEEESMEWSGLPETLIIDESSPFPGLAKFYIYSKKLLDEYYDIPSKDRLDYRKANPGIDAVLFFWYKTSTVRSKGAQDIVVDLFSWYGIDKNPYMHPANLPEVPEELKLIPE